MYRFDLAGLKIALAGVGTVMLAMAPGLLFGDIYIILRVVLGFVLLGGLGLILGGTLVQFLALWQRRSS